MLGVLHEDRGCSSIMQFFIDTPFDNLFVVDSDGRVVCEVDQFTWRRFIASDFDHASPIKAVLSSYRSHVASLQASVAARKSSRFSRLEAMCDGESGRLRGTVVSRLAADDDVGASALIMAGGLGRRLGDLTANTPKPMLDLAGAPIAAHLVDNLVDNGFRDIFFSLFHLKNVVRDHFGDGSGYGCSVRYLEEKTPLGTAGCLSLLPNDFDRPLLIVNGDVVTNVQFARLVEFHEGSGADITMSVRPHTIAVQYGVVDHENGQVSRIREKPKFSVDINLAIYVLSPRVLRHIPHGRAIDMPTLIENVIPLGFKVMTFPLLEEWIDVGTIPDLQRARGTYDPNVRPRLRAPEADNVVPLKFATGA